MISKDKYTIQCDGLDAADGAVRRFSNGAELETEQQCVPCSRRIWFGEHNDMNDLKHLEHGLQKKLSFSAPGHGH